MNETFPELDHPRPEPICTKHGDWNRECGCPPTTDVEKYSIREVDGEEHLFRYEEDKGLPNNAELQFWYSRKQPSDRTCGLCAPDICCCKLPMADVEEAIFAAARQLGITSSDDFVILRRLLASVVDKLQAQLAHQQPSAFVGKKPCKRCGVFFYEDEKECPHCSEPRQPSATVGLWQPSAITTNEQAYRDGTLSQASATVRTHDFGEVYTGKQPSAKCSDCGRDLSKPPNESFGYCQKCGQGFRQPSAITTNEQVYRDGTLSQPSTSELLEVLKAMYLKHHCGYDDEGWDALGDRMQNALCNVMGDTDFCKWLDEERSKHE